MRWAFEKYVGCGNDFILFDNRLTSFPLDQIEKICRRQNGIGADGILLLEQSSIADFKMRIFNSDGSEAEMCGNGLRCFIQWLRKDKKILQDHYKIEVMGQVLAAYAKEDQIFIEMGSPTQIEWNISHVFNGRPLKIHSLNTGVPHIILFTDNIDQIDVRYHGKLLRNHPDWQPKGTNVNFVQVSDGKNLSIRTYERGVEDETLACGTGAVAAALAASFIYQMRSPITVKTRSSEALMIYFNDQKSQFSDVILSGPAKCVFKGELNMTNL